MQTVNKMFTLRDTTATARRVPLHGPQCCSGAVIRNNITLYATYMPVQVLHLRNSGSAAFLSATNPHSCQVRDVNNLFRTQV